VNPNYERARRFLEDLRGPLDHAGVTIEVRDDGFALRGTRRAEVVLPERPVNGLDVLNCICRARDEVLAP
jgi:hypothetical protein